MSLKFSQIRFNYKIIIASIIGLIILSAVIFTILLIVIPQQNTISTDLTGLSSKKIITTSNAPESKEIRLYFVNPETTELAEEKREIYLSEDYVERIKQVLQELIKGSATGMLNPIPNDTNVREVFFEQKREYVYVDFSKSLSKSHIGGVTGEFLTIQSIIKTLQTNFPEIRKVQILIDDKYADTIAGHIDISQPLSIEETTEPK